MKVKDISFIIVREMVNYSAIKKGETNENIVN